MSDLFLLSVEFSWNPLFICLLLYRDDASIESVVREIVLLGWVLLEGFEGDGMSEDGIE